MRSKLAKNPYDCLQVRLSSGRLVTLPVEWHVNRRKRWAWGSGHLEHFIPAEIVYLYEWDQLTFREIAELFSTLGVPGRSGGSQWSGDQVRHYYRVQVKRREGERIELVPDEHSEGVESTEDFMRMIREEINDNSGSFFDWTTEELDWAGDVARQILEFDDKYDYSNPTAFAHQARKAERELATQGV